MKRDGEISAGRKTAHEPEEQSLGLIEIDDRIQKHDHGGDEGIKNHAGKQQVIRMKPPVEQRKAVDQHHAQQRAEKRRQRDPRDFPEQPSRDGQKPVWEKEQSQDSAQGSAARHTKHLRTGERIAEQSLQDDAAG